MAGLATAWELTQPGNQHGYDQITVYQRGHRLGGKGASSRGANARIEEHGLHVWLGYYDNAFRLMRECYDELDRPTTSPDCPILTWTDAFERASEVGVTDRLGGEWATWVAQFAENDSLPGDPSIAPLDPAALMQRALQLLSDFSTSASPPQPSLYFSASPDPSPERQAAPALQQMLHAAQLAMTAIASKGLATLSDRLPASFADNLTHVRTMIERRTSNDLAGQRTLLLVDLVTTCLLGMYSDQVGSDVHRLTALDAEDFRDWLRRHGASQATLDSGIVRGLYDLVFAFEDGDVERPAFPAGLGLFLAGKIFFDYRGAIFWKMTAGMGDVVFAPMYQALRERGVDFEFFHDVTALRLNDQGDRVTSIELLRQVDVDDDGYEPLADYGGLACFPDEPLTDQLVDPDRPGLSHLESHFRDRSDESPIVLAEGDDFDDLVLATSIGALPIIATDLVDRVPGWRQMIDGVPTVATQALQLWLTDSEQDMACVHPGATVSGFVEPFDTWASMTHLVEIEDWSSVDPPPQTIAYFCSPLPTEIDPDSTIDDITAEHRRIGDHADRFIERDLGHFFPGATGPEGFDESLIVDRYVRANVDPSDRYVRSQPGTAHHRLRPDRSGVDNLVLAGDWTDCGLNAGCIEAATLSGIQAANALLGRSRPTRILGVWPGLVA